MNILSPLFISLACVMASAQYTTNFPLTKNPISENANWLNGGVNGASWSDVQTTPGLAFGTAIQQGPPYSDSVATLTGIWATTQSACATVFLNMTTSKRNSHFYEVELHLNQQITPNNAPGYEFNYSLKNNGSQYAQLVKWNGSLNAFSGLAGTTPPALANGDVLCAFNTSGQLKFTRNGTTLFTWTNTSLTGGSPGVGFYNERGTLADNALFGFTNFAATGMQGPPPPRVPNPPSSVSGVASIVASGNLSWTVSTGATSYTVYRSNVSGGPYTVLGSSTTLIYTDTGLSTATSYYYVVTAANTSGGSTFSSEVAIVVH